MQAIVFDFFGVICSEITPFVLPRYMSAEAAVAYKASVVERADLGEIDLAEVLDHLSALTGAVPAALEAEFWACVKIDPEVVALIERLKTRYRTALLSNAMRPFLRQILEKHDLPRLFDEMVISCEEHVTKPNPAIYRLMTGRLGLAPSECFFTDDNPANVRAARGVGMQAAQFTGVETLKRDLLAAGVTL
ncbi:HAD family hydrolase [Rhizomicrobium electricum]|uniref:HAD family phosphatase n=1 Tax=Rhizomicrobium electricum TaxID=480070 RepID=A0ABP3PZQ8_9PROT|nr:HAD family phosphatase [Rhizomicrobium electricum]NIJ49999.1 HAD superfamily hydrolase (TIGR01509 family) [Rhizomicrobium electricum]